MLQGIRQLAISISLLLLLSTCRILAQGQAGLSGTVRDLKGQPQMGVLIELLGPSASSTALTDLEGNYQIRNVLPGLYELRATATLFVPNLRRQLRLQPKTTSIVNLTMSGLFDETSWMSASRPGNLAERDDWKWTLRSPANRPLLRLIGAANAPVEGGQAAAELHGALAFESARGDFGDSPSAGRLLIRRRFKDGKQSLALGSLIAAAPSEQSDMPISVSALLEAEGPSGRKHRSSVRLSTYPQVRTPQGASLTELVVGSAERMPLAEFALLEVGSETQLLTAGTSAVTTRPYLRLSSRPIGGWSAGYAVATAPGLSRYDDLGESRTSAPTAVIAARHLRTESGIHQEASVRRSLGKAKLQLTYSRDDLRNVALTGVLQRARAGNAPGVSRPSNSQTIVLDERNGTFRLLAPGAPSSGFGVMIDRPLGEHATVSGGYLSGVGAVQRTSSSDGTDDRFRMVRANALLASLAGQVQRTGTRVSVTYRWQPETSLSTVTPYALPGVQPYLGLHLSQTLPGGVEVYLDGENLARQGYQATAVAQQQAVLASELRELRTGLSVTF